MTVQDGVRHGEMGNRCAACEDRAAEALASDGRLMCKPCIRRKKLRVAQQMPTAPAGAHA